MKNIHNFVNMIMEEVSINDYTNEDFVDVYFMVFKNWVKENYGEQELKYPFSYIKKKYEGEFLKFYDLRTDRWSGEYLAMKNYGKQFVERSLYAYEELPKTDSSWFDKPLNQKIWKSVEKQFDFPSYMDVNVVETRPRNLLLRVNVNFPEFVKSKEKNPYPTSFRLVEDIKKYMEKYGGVKFGNPLHGDLKLSEGPYTYDGLEDWMKNTLNKEIKKTIKDKVKNVAYRGLQFEIKHGKPIIKILFSSRGWSAKQEARDEVESIIRNDLGYSDNLKITGY